MACPRGSVTRFRGLARWPIVLDRKFHNSVGWRRKLVKYIRMDASLRRVLVV
jgi:hypothetical protein